MQIHEREQIVRKAERELSDKVLEWAEKWSEKLTPGEELKVVSVALGRYLGSMAKYQIREERHGNSETPGGLAG